MDLCQPLIDQTYLFGEALKIATLLCFFSSQKGSIITL